MPTATPRPGSKRVYTTNVATGGNLGGISGADALCMSSSRRPSSVTAAKAFVVDGTHRRACQTAACPNTERINWVFKPNTSYVDGSAPSKLLFETDAKGLIIFAGIREYMDPVASIWTGLNTDWTTSTKTCRGFTNGTIQYEGIVGSNFLFTSNSIGFSPWGCHLASAYLMCVEQ